MFVMNLPNLDLPKEKIFLKNNLLTEHENYGILSHTPFAAVIGS